MKVNTPEKIVPYKCCLPSSSISVKKNFDQTVFLTNIVAHFHVLSVIFFEHGQNVNKQYLIDKAGKMGWG